MADEFEISLRILGNEVIGMQLKSESRARNWAAFGLIAMIIVTALLAQAVPLIKELSLP